MLVYAYLCECVHEFGYVDICVCLSVGVVLSVYVWLVGWLVEFYGICRLFNAK